MRTAARPPRSVRRPALPWVLARVVLVAVALAGCGPGADTPRIDPTPIATTVPRPPTPGADGGPVGQPTQVAKLAAAARVQRVFAGVAAGPGDVNPIPRLPDDQPRDLPERGVVSTDPNGEARVDIRGCSTVHVFQSSQLIASSCARSDVVSGNPTCLSGTSAFNNRCTGQVMIETRSAQIELQGTWLSVTYLPDRRMSLTMLFEGQARVWPVRDFDRRTLGEPVVVGAGHFWFSDPGDAPSSVAGLRGRRVYPFDEASPVLAELNMQPWLPRIQRRAAEANVSFPRTLLGNAAPTATATARALLTATPTARVVPTGTPTSRPIPSATPTANISAAQTARAATAQSVSAALTATARAGPIVR